MFRIYVLLCLFSFGFFSCFDRLPFELVLQQVKCVLCLGVVLWGGFWYTTFCVSNCSVCRYSHLNKGKPFFNLTKPLCFQSQNKLGIAHILNQISSAGHKITFSQRGNDFMNALP